MTNVDTDSELKEMSPSHSQETGSWIFLLVVGIPPADVNPSFAAQVGHTNHLKYFPGFLGRGYLGMVFLDVLQTL